MKYNLLLLFFLFSFYTQGQFISDKYADSLEVKLILEDDLKRVEILNRLSEHYVRNQPKRALENAQNALALARKINNKPEETQALRNVGISIQYLISEYDSALQYCFEALKISEQNNLPAQSLKTNIAIANIYYEVGNYSKSIDYLTRGEVIGTKITDRPDVVNIKVLKSKAFLQLDLLNEAIEELKSALKICKLHELDRPEAMVRIAMGEYYVKVANEELSEIHLKTALEILKQQGTKFEYSNALISMANHYSSFNQPEKAIPYLNESLNIKKSIGDDLGIAECHLFLGHNLNKAQNYEKATEHLKLSRTIAEKLNAKRILRRVYNQSYIAYSGLENIEKAREFRDLYVSITELIFSEESERQIAEVQAKYDIAQKDMELEVQQERLSQKSLQFERERKLNLLLLLVLIISVGFAGLAFYNYREKKKVNKRLEEINIKTVEQNKELKKLNDTKDKFFSIIGHDIKGPLASLTSFLSLLKNHTTKLTIDEIKALAEDLDKSVKNLQSFLENLLTWARSQTNSIELKSERLVMNKLVEENFNLLRTQAMNKNIDLVLSAKENIEVLADKNTISTVIRNLLSNAIKFTHEYGKIQVKLDEWKDAVEVSVKDNGIGMSEEALKKLFQMGTKHSTVGTNKEKGTGLGLILCKEFVEMHKGQIRVNSKIGEGTTFSFTLPKGKP